MISKSKDHNPNYLAKIITVKNLRKHSNADKLNVFTVDGNDIITSINTPENQLSVYFPLESKISHTLLSANNDYRKASSDTGSTFGMNSDSENAGGFFDANGRVRAVRLRGQKSEGYVVPVTYLECIIGDKSVNLANHIGEEFDTIEGFKIVEKYVIPKKSGKLTEGNERSKKKKISKLIDNQFRLHYDTNQLGKNLHKIKPEDLISITWKLHGTSFVSSKVLCARKLPWYDRIAKFFGINVRETEYDNLYSSRKVIKNDDLNKNGNHYYKYDLWKEANDLLKDNLLAGESVYGEIVGFTKDGGYIQKDFDYKCGQNEFKVYVYRITHTTADGKVIDVPFNMVQERCEQLGVSAVPPIYFGLTGDFLTNYTGISYPKDGEFGEQLLNVLKTLYVYDQDSKFCNNKVPEEGIVLRTEGLKPEAFKLKAFKFLEYETKQLDKGEENIEDSQTDD